MGLPKSRGAKQASFLCFPTAVARNHYAQRFPSGTNFDPFERNSIARMIAHGDVARTVGDRTMSPRAIFPFEVNQAPMAFGRNWSTARSTKTALPVVESILHLRNQICARNIVPWASVDQVSVIHKSVADKRDNGAGDSRDEGSAASSSAHHVNDGCTHHRLSRRSSTVALSETLERDIDSFERSGRNSKSSANEVLHLLQGSEHGDDRARRASESKHAKDREGMDDSVVAGLGLV
jgi:hypothetical protein